MHIDDVKVGMQVVFGRENGEKTLGEVVKINPKRVKVRTLEDRGQRLYNAHGQYARPRSPAGALWNVPACLMEPVPPTV